MENNFIKDNPLATLTTLILYFGACAGLWYVGYWSVFEVNYLQYLEISDIIKDFVEPFFTSAIVVIAVIVLAPLYYHFLDESLDIKKTNKPKIDNEATPKWTKRIIRGLLFVSIVIIFLISDKYSRLEMLPSLLAVYLNIYLMKYDFLSNYIEKFIIRLGICYFITVLPMLSFCYSRSNALLVWDNMKYKYIKTITFKEDIGQDVKNYKLLGTSRSTIILANLSNSEIFILNSDNIISMSYGEVKIKRKAPGFDNIKDF